jgi:signal transduction histidine kinase
MSFWRTFRVRLLIVLGAMLAATLGVQYYLNLQIERHNLEHRTQRQKTVVGGLILGFNSLTSSDRMLTLKDAQPSFREYEDRLANILVIDEEWRVYDSLNQELLPGEGEEYRKLGDLKDLPPLSNALQLGADRDKFPNAVEDKPSTQNGESFALPVETDQGRWYVMVVLKPEEREPLYHAAQPLTYMLFILLASTLLTMILVWRFTRPVASLSAAAQQIAGGDLTARVPEVKRRDEMGQLVMNFNEMAAELEKKSEIETQLRQAEKLAVVGRLVSAIAHEIRNPLNYVNLTLDHLRAKFAPKEEKPRETFDRLIVQLKSEVERINRQITDLLRYSRPLKLDLQPTDINQVIENSLHLAERQAEEQSVDISVVKEGVIPQISGDAEYLRSVFSNLFINAVQAMQKGGKLNVEIERENNFVVVKVADTGSGIPPENLDRVFEPYFSTKETGTGLGLAIVKKIVEDHHGTIEVYSAPSEGTVFTVRLPAVT